MSEPIYQIHDLTKCYQGRRVLDVPRLDVRRGEILALVGPSGAGKSTLLRLLNFLESPTSGRIRFLDAEFGPHQEIPVTLRRRVTTVFQRPILLKRTVQANVSYGLRLRGQRDGHHVIAAALGQVGLQPLAQQPARTLSGGEAQRVALARAMVLEPDVLLLDEPTANLDPYNVGLIEDTARQLNRERGTTLVLVTHNVFQAKRLAHRVALMLEGRVVEVADVQTFFDAPRDPRTAAFVRGEMVY
ncbi:MAG: phosphate ABC transporter ATP-binding protein [Chloroflexi bacterium HGW-Chloroflexi-1]|nr:MAG: phosphate ABC transporter ATP-binding protein [Chloroflexi bacterium HGW-Chloroflexi-1]